MFIQMNIRTMNTLPAVWLNCFNLISRIILVVLSFNKSTSCRISLVGSSWLIPDQKVLAALFRSSRMWRWHTKLNLARVLVRLFRPDTNIMQIISLAITHILAQSNDVVSLIKLHSASRWITARKLRIAHIWSSSARREEFPRMPLSLPKKYTVVSLFDKCFALTAAHLHSSLLFFSVFSLFLLSGTCNLLLYVFIVY